MIAVILAAGVVGAVLRYLVGCLLGSPWAVLAVNVAGSFIGGVVAAAAVSTELRLALLTGLCGGLTTFSTLSVETMQLVMRKKLRLALLSVGLNLVLGIGAATAGYLLGAASGG